MTENDSGVNPLIFATGTGVQPWRETILLVHGTFAAPRKDGPPQWYEPGSGFTDALDAELKRRGSEARCWAHIVDRIKGSGELFSWSGANHWLDRHEAAVRLASLLDRLVADGWRCHVVAHSHGGNVLVEALRRMRRSSDPGKADAFGSGSLVTLGTPFVTFPSMRNPFFAELIDDSSRKGAGASAWTLVLNAVLVLGVLAGMHRLAIIDIAAAWNNRPSLKPVVLTIGIAAFAGLVLLLLRVFDAKLVGAYSQPRWRRMLVLGSEHDETWQVLRGLLNPPARTEGQSEQTTQTSSRISSNGLWWKRVGQLISARDAIIFPGRNFLVDVLGWSSVVLVCAAASRNPAALTEALPGIALGYLALLVAGLVGSARMTRATLCVPVRALGAFIMFCQYVTGTAVTSLVQRKAMPTLRLKAAGLDYSPTGLPQVSHMPGHVDECFFEYRALPHDVVAEILENRNVEAGSALGIVLDTLGLHGFGSAELDALLDNIGNNVSLCHAAYYTKASCIEMIGQWVARTEQQLSQDEQAHENS